MIRQSLRLLMLAATLFAMSGSICAQSTTDHLSGKTMLVFGDSYVKNHREPMENTWHYKLAARHNMRYVNFGRNGSSIAFDRTRDGFGPSMLTRLGQLNEPADYVLVIAGHNDAFIVRNSADTLRLFQQRLEAFCTGLRSKYPQAAIGFVTPWAVEKPGFEVVTQSIRKACKRHGFALLDAARESGIRPMDEDFRRQYFQGPNDQAHLNATGHGLLLDWGERFIRRLMEKKR